MKPQKYFLDKNVNDKIEKAIKESIATKETILTNGLIPEIQKGVRLIVHAYQQGGKLLLCGNGGSASDAQHIAAELVGRFSKERRSLPALALSSNISTLSSIGNDYNFESIYSRQVEGYMQKEDVLIAISTSGNSPNILAAVKKAKEVGGKTIGFTGESGGKLKGEVDLLINVPSKETPRIQESHILIGHIVCDLIEQELFS